MKITRVDTSEISLSSVRKILQDKDIPFNKMSNRVQLQKIVARIKQTKCKDCDSVYWIDPENHGDKCYSCANIKEADHTAYAKGVLGTKVEMKPEDIKELTDHIKEGVKKIIEPDKKESKPARLLRELYEHALEVQEQINPHDYPSPIGIARRVVRVFTSSNMDF